MIGFLVHGRVRIKIRLKFRNRIRVGVIFNVSIYHDNEQLSQEQIHSIHLHKNILVLAPYT